MTAAVRRLARLGLVALVAAWLLDRRLAGRAGGEPDPIASLVVIDAPIGRVWEVLADVEGQPRWMHEMKEVRLTTPPPVGVGTRGVATVRILGISVQDPVEVVAFEPPTRFEIEHAGLFAGRGRIDLEAGADGSTTIVRWGETLIAPVLPHLWAAAARPILASIFQADLGHLRDLVEADAA